VQDTAGKGGKAEKKGEAGAPALGTATRIGARDWVYEDPGKDDDRAYYEQEVRCESCTLSANCATSCSHTLHAHFA
jgi:hypothetical protein